MAADEGSNSSVKRKAPRSSSSYPVLLWAGKSGFKTLYITTSKLTIGSAASANVKLQDPAVQQVHAHITEQDQTGVVEAAAQECALVVEGRTASRQQLKSGLNFEIGASRFWFFEKVTPLSPNLIFSLDFTSGSRQWQLIDIRDHAMIGRIGPDVVLAHDSGVSGQHAEIRCLGMELAFIRDLGSSNGTFVNGEEIDGRAHRLYIGDEVQVGQARFNLRLRKLEESPGAEPVGLRERKTELVISASATELTDLDSGESGREAPRDLPSPDDELSTDRYPVEKKAPRDLPSPGDELPTDRYPVEKKAPHDLPSPGGELPTERYLPAIDGIGASSGAPLGDAQVSVLVEQAANEEEELAELFRKRDEELGEQPGAPLEAPKLDAPAPEPSTHVTPSRLVSLSAAPSPVVPAPDAPSPDTPAPDAPSPVASATVGQRDQSRTSTVTTSVRLPKRKRSHVWLIIALLLIVGVAGFFALRELSKPRPAAAAHTQVPQLSRLPLTMARNLLRARALVLHEKTPRSDPAIEAGLVISQSIVAGALVEKGTVIEVVVSSGPAAPAASAAPAVSAAPAASRPPKGESSTPRTSSSQTPGLVTVPQLAQLSLPRAKGVLRRAGLRTGAIARRPTRALRTRHVISSNPAAGEQVSAGTAIKLVVSSGRSEILVPRLLGVKEKVARRKLKRAGLQVGRVTYIYDDRRLGLVILKQNPGPGTPVSKETMVDLVVNEGD